MSRRLPRRRDTDVGGRRPLLTTKVHADIVELLEAGNAASTAARMVGVTPDTVYEWMRKGREADALQSAGQALDERQAVYARFARDVQRAQAHAEVDAVAVVEKVMHGGYLVSEEETIGPDGTRTVRRTWGQPDGRLAMEYLARTAPERWGRQGVSKVEISGPGGGPIFLEEGSMAASLARRWAEVRALEGVVDAEVVEDADSR
jgi:hypothetical protein